MPHDDGRDIEIVFDGPPGPEAGRFVEVECPSGVSVGFGEWHQREDGYWVLRFGLADVQPLVTRREMPRHLDVWERRIIAALSRVDGVMLHRHLTHSTLADAVRVVDALRSSQESHPAANATATSPMLNEVPRSLARVLLDRAEMLLRQARDLIATQAARLAFVPPDVIAVSGDIERLIIDIDALRASENKRAEGRS